MMNTDIATTTKSVAVLTEKPPMAASIARRNVYVASMPLTWGTAQLCTLFQPFGNIEQCKVMADRRTGQCQGYGFVLFASETSAAASIDAMNGKTFDGRRLQVRLAHASACPNKGRDPQQQPQEEGSTGAPAYRSENSGVTEPNYVESSGGFQSVQYLTQQPFVLPSSMMQQQQPTVVPAMTLGGSGGFSMGGSLLSPQYATPAIVFPSSMMQQQQQQQGPSAMHTMTTMPPMQAMMMMMPPMASQPTYVWTVPSMGPR